jgi:hypothetical protein
VSALYTAGSRPILSLPDDIKAVRNGEGEWQITLRVFRDLGIVLALLLLGGVMA